MRRSFKKGVVISKRIIYRETLIDTKEHFWSFLGAFIGIGMIAYLQSNWLTKQENIFLIGSFGASSVLIYGTIKSPLAQPRNLIGGHVVSALVGVSVYKYFPEIIWLTAPTAVALSIVLMQITKTLHPPGGATALIAVVGPERVKSLGYEYVLNPVLSGAVILLIVALIFNNITSHRTYPENSRTIRFLKRIYRNKISRKR